jgi:hypothetical protein
MASGESKKLRRYDKENLLWQSTVVIKSDPVGPQPPNHQTKANTGRGKNGIIHAMKPHVKTALSLALAIVGGIAAGMRCDASEWVENSSQYAIGGAAYTVRRQGSVPSVLLGFHAWGM